MKYSLNRKLCAKYKNRTYKEFSVSISFPTKEELGFKCVVDTNGFLSDQALAAYGDDPIDAIEYAIHLLDVLIFEREIEFEVLWPDKSKYRRSKTLNYRWSDPEDQGK